MSTSTQFQQLTKPTEASDFVDVDVLNVNFDKIDKIGQVLCTSGTRPAVGLFNGLIIYETDTKLQYIYDGAAWQPYGLAGPKGFIGSATDGGTTLSTTAITEATGSRVSIASQSSKRKYKVTCTAVFNAAAAVYGLYRVQGFQGGGVGAIGRDGKAPTSVAGGAGQIAIGSVADVTINAGTPVVFSGAVQRVNGGSATDSATSTYCLVEDMGWVP